MGLEVVIYIKLVTIDIFYGFEKDFAFFFYISKAIVLKKCQKKHLKYTQCIRGQKRKKRQKATPSLHLQPNQSMKSKRDNKLDSIYTLTHSKNMYIKERKIAWSVSSKSLKALWFLSFYKVQNKHKGVAFQTFFLFFPTKAPC